MTSHQPSDTPNAPDTASLTADALAEYWEERYASSEHLWSGRVNQVLAEVAATLTPGSALDLGCGEGGDALWLATQGWQTTGVDISATAIERGRQAANAHHLTDAQLRFEVGDLATWQHSRQVDLVTCSFLHSWPISIDREHILRRATRFVRANGHVLITAHASAPPWAPAEMLTRYTFPSPESDLAALQLDLSQWQVAICETRQRQATGPNGSTGTLTDSVLLVQRTPAPDTARVSPERTP